MAEFTWDRGEIVICVEMPAGWSIRAWIAGALIRLAAFVLGVGIEIDISTADALATPVDE